MDKRTFYDTPAKIYNLLTTHPMLNSMITEFGVDIDNVKLVSNYLYDNHNDIIETQTNYLYNDSIHLNQIGELYGFNQPWQGQISQSGTTLLEFLNFTLYIYKFGVTDNFYEKNILDFLPEYDRELINEEPQLKLTFESIGRKLDQLEDYIYRIQDLYNIDEIPDDLLDYLGQNLGYEREDYTLQNVSFRELLRNIVEIYKIKGTNYSFSFFFKFLGFDVTLKEFFFNRDVENPESFPGVEENRVEYYLSTINPIYDISLNKPAKYLRSSKNLNDWEIERQSLESKGCTNSIQYMLGFESFNNDGETWHKNPWTYFKTNLMEYQLDTFLDKLNLTANDNETIRKYVKFLSPTYLFTWINVNLTPWIENVNIISDSQNDWLIEIIKTLGDPRPTPEPWPFTRKESSDQGFNGFNDDGQYLDYEPLDRILTIYNGGEEIYFDLENNMDLGGVDVIGTVLRRDGVYVRQPGHPKNITNIRHKGDKKISFDFMNVGVREHINENNIQKYNTYSDLPITLPDGSFAFIRFDTDNNPRGYYKWHANISEWRKIDYSDYSYRPYPAIPINPIPGNNQLITSNNTLSFGWEDISGAESYWIQVATDSQFNNIVIDVDSLEKSEYSSIEYLNSDTTFSNNRYYWRVKTRNNSDFSDLDVNNPLEPSDYIWGPWSSTWNFTLKSLPFPFNGEILDKQTFFVKKEGQSARFSLLWRSVLNSEEYRIQVSTNKPFVWDSVDTINYSQSLSSLTDNYNLGDTLYIVDESAYFKYTSTDQNWVEIPQSQVVEYSVASSFNNISQYEQRLGDTWYVEDDDKYYRWSSIENSWLPTTTPECGCVGNVNLYQDLLLLESQTNDIYYVLAEDVFYQYKPIEDTQEEYRLLFDTIQKEISLPVTLGSGQYYWRVMPKHTVYGWQDWLNLNTFIINF